MTTPIRPAGAALLAVLLLSACASSPEPPPEPGVAGLVGVEEGEPGGVAVETTRVSARVVGIDRIARTAVLLGPDGEAFEVRVGPEAVNFDQVEVGDGVTATLTQSLVVAMADPGAPLPDGEAAGVALAPVGAKPGAVVADTVRVTGTVIGIDEEARTATLRFGDGSTRTFPVRPDVDLSRRSVGEQVVFQVTETVAIDVWKE